MPIPLGTRGWEWLQATQAEESFGARQGLETYQLRCFDPFFQTTILETSRNGFLHGSDSVRSQHAFLQCLRSLRAMCFLAITFSRNVAQCCGAGFQKVGYVIGACDNILLSHRLYAPFTQFMCLMLTCNTQH